MATSIEAKIVDVLLTYFQGLTLPAGVLAGVRLAVPNFNFVPDGNPYVRLSIIKNEPINASLSGGREPIRLGLLVATVCWPLGQGIVKPSELAATIRDAFKFNTRIDAQGIRIVVPKEPTVKSDQTGATYMEIPVIIPWGVYG